MKKLIAVFDLDNTILNVDSTKEFIKFYIKKKKNIFNFFYFILCAFLDELGFLSDLKKRLVKIFRNVKYEALLEITSEFADIAIVKFSNDEILTKIKDLKEKEYLIIILSGAIDPVVKIIGKKLSADYSFGSPLVERNKILTGEVEEIRFKKNNFIYKLEKEIGEIDFENSFCFSDNKEDLYLLKIFGNSYGIVFDRTKKKYFEDRGIRTIFINPKLTINEKLFLFPGVYYLYSRRHSKSLRLLLFYYIAIPLIGLFFLKKPFYYSDILIFVFSFLGYFSFYEIGTLINDVIVVKKEKEPTFRVDVRLSESLKILIFGKIVVFILIAFFLFIYKPNYNINLYIFLNILTALVFCLHNILISEKYLFFKLITISLLKFSNYLVPLSLFYINIFYVILGYLIFQWPQNILDFYFDKIKKTPKPLKIDNFYTLYLFFVLVALVFFVKKQFLGFYFLVYGFYLLFIKLMKDFKNFVFILKKN